MKTLKTAVLPVQILAFIMLVCISVIAFVGGVSCTISMLTSLSFTDVSDSTPMWVVTGLLFTPGMLIAMGDWMWGSAK